MATMTSPMASIYRQSDWFDLDPLFKRCLSIAGSIGLVFLVAVFLAPRRPPIEITHVDQVPERFAKLILEETPKPPPVLPKPAVQRDTARPGPAAGEKGNGSGPRPAPEGRGENLGDNPGRRGARSRGPVSTPGVGANVGLSGGAGRARAQAEVTSQLADVTSSLNNVVSELATTLSSGGGVADVPASRRPRKGAVRSGRTGAEIGSIPSGPIGGGSPDGKGKGTGSAQIRGDLLDIGSILQIGGGGGDGGDGTGLGGPGPGGVPGGARGGRAGGRRGGTGDGSGGGGGAGSGGGGGELRSDASLLAVVRKYSAGIRFCYDTELKRNDTLRGKLVVAITVAASGEVTEARPVQDTLGSTALTECALAQIRSWKFPQIPAGTVTFQAPFVFTPPDS